MTNGAGWRLLPLNCGSHKNGIRCCSPYVKKGSGIPFGKATPSFILLINFLCATHLFYTCGRCQHRNQGIRIILLICCDNIIYIIVFTSHILYTILKISPFLPESILNIFFCHCKNCYQFKSRISCSILKKPTFRSCSRYGIPEDIHCRRHHPRPGWAFVIAPPYFTTSLKIIPFISQGKEVLKQFGCPYIILL